MSLPEEPIARLRFIMSHLRSAHGCPWDQAQTPVTLKPYLLEEVHELLDALNGGDEEEIRDELGDLLLQVVFLTEIFNEKESFNLDDVATSICNKLIRRHPHVFENTSENDNVDLDRQWETIKNSEQRRPVNTRLGNPLPPMPALLAAQKMTQKAARTGFDWSQHEAVIDQLEEEITELKEALAANERDHAIHEFGDILLTVVNLGRQLDIDAETTLQQTMNRFRSRFIRMEELIAADHLDIDSIDLDCMNGYWQQAKKDEQAD